MRMDELVAPPRKARKRVGRGNASGHGTYSGRGIKGQKARSGGGPHPRFEGGQLPLIKRLPEKRGFTNKWRTEYAIFNVEEFSELPEGTEISPEVLRDLGLLKENKPVKILGDGDLQVKLTVRAHKFSASAKAKIEACGGTVEELPYEAPRHSRSRGPAPRPKSPKKKTASA
ncbi:MAG: 50S ribosomal protein L15 [Chloroflexota bacterium]|nr:50S ribosomal protein L15 [Dehalococcoidia bacterium]MDW8254822.1 50S ribosomal protein L15 [Chloroflexota bacterium]